jgi:serine/threonine protein kinase
VTAEAAELRAGVRVDGRYELLEPLSATRRTWLAKPPGKLARRVVIKLVEPGPGADAWRADMAKLATLSTQYVVRVIEHGEWNGWLFAAMPALEKGTILRRWIGPSLRDENKLLLPRILKAAAAMHDGGIVHGELTPDNVLVISMRDGPVLLGGSRLRAKAPSPAAYIAPEIAAGGAPTERSDVWQLGLLCHEVLAGSLPGEDLRVSPKVDAIWRGSSPVLERCLARDPAARYANAREFDRAIGRRRRATTVAIVMFAAASAVVAAAAGLLH